MFQVLACPRCRKAKIVEVGKKTTSCGACGRTLTIADLRAHATTESLDEAAEAAGRLNAKLAGREAEFDAAFMPAAPARVAHDDAYDAAAAATRKAASEKDRVDALARALGATVGAFSAEQLAAAFERAGLPSAKVEDHLARMLASSVLFEPRAGQYSAF